jgi:hypothetical protein
MDIASLTPYHVANTGLDTMNDYFAADPCPKWAAVFGTLGSALGLFFASIPNQ